MRRIVEISAFIICFALVLAGCAGSGGGVSSAGGSGGGTTTTYSLSKGMYRLAFSANDFDNSWLVNSVSSGTITATHGCRLTTANGTVSGNTIAFTWTSDGDTVSISATLSANNTFSGSVTVSGASAGTVTGTYVGTSYTRETWTVTNTATADTASLCYTNETDGTIIEGRFTDTVPCDVLNYCGMQASWAQTGSSVIVTLYSSSGCYAKLYGTISGSNINDGTFDIFNSSSNTNCGDSQSNGNYTAVKQ